MDAVAAVRVSSAKQGLQGDSLETQMDQIKIRCQQLSSVLGSPIRIKHVFEFTQSASGELDTQPVQEVISYIKTNPGIKYFFIKSVDRFTRAGSTIYGLLKSQLTRYGVQIIDCYGVISSQEVNTLGHLGVSYDWSTYSPSYITEILESERSKSEVRDILTRMLGAEIGYIRLGYRVRPAPMGYRNKKIDTEHGRRVILEPHPLESPWFTAMFDLKARGKLTYTQIVDEINAMGYRSRAVRRHDPLRPDKIIGYKGQKQLTLKQLNKYIPNPIYAGVNTEKWTNGKPIKTKFPGLVSVETWNKANRGKWTIVEDGDSVILSKGSNKVYTKNTSNPKFAYRREVLCPHCNSHLYGGSSRGKAGGYFDYYECRKGHKRWAIKAGTLHETVRNFVEDIELNESTFAKLKEKIIRKYEERRESLTGNSLSLAKQIEKLTADKASLMAKIKYLTSEVVIKSLETDVTEMDLQIEQLKVNEKKKTLEYYSVQEIIGAVYYYLEHFDELLLGGADPNKNAAMFGLLFMEPPNYRELELRTPKLADIFRLKNEKLHSRKPICEPAGTNYEPLFEYFNRFYYTMNKWVNLPAFA